MLNEQNITPIEQLLSPTPLIRTYIQHLEVDKVARMRGGPEHLVVYPGLPTAPWLLKLNAFMYRYENQVQVERATILIGADSKPEDPKYYTYLSLAPEGCSLLSRFIVYYMSPAPEEYDDEKPEQRYLKRARRHDIRVDFFEGAEGPKPNSFELPVKGHDCAR